MTLLKIDDDNAIFHIHHAAPEGAPTFVFINALTGNTGAWEGVVAPRLREAGFGTLSWNFRGQADSPFGLDVELTNEVIVDDLMRVLEAAAPARPVLVGLSVGGLYAAQAIARGARAEALVLLNTLRRIGPRIAWVNDALPVLVGAGGFDLFMDAVFPMLVNPEFLSNARANALKGGYQPLDPAHGHSNLMRNSPSTDWDFDWSSLDLPVLSITGAHDRVFRDPEIIEELYATLPNATREDWDDCGHLVPVERPEKLAASLIRFGEGLGR